MTVVARQIPGRSGVFTYCELVQVGSLCVLHAGVSWMAAFWGRIKVSSGEPQHEFSLECAQRRNRIEYLRKSKNAHRLKKGFRCTEDFRYFSFIWFNALSYMFRSLPFVRTTPFCPQNENIGMFVSGIVFCNEFSCSDIPTAFLATSCDVSLCASALGILLRIVRRADIV